MADSRVQHVDGGETVYLEVTRSPGGQRILIPLRNVHRIEERVEGCNVFIETIVGGQEILYVAETFDTVKGQYDTAVNSIKVSGA